MRNITLVATVAIAAVALTACGRTGVNRARPDEFATARQAPLVIPPDFSLTPPQPGAARPQDTGPSQQALEALFEKKIEGFGETFRWISFQKIGTSTMQSRATAGVANATYIFALPGSTGACKDGWDDILRQQLDIRFRPCNFAELMPRF